MRPAWNKEAELVTAARNKVKLMYNTTGKVFRKEDVDVAVAIGTATVVVGVK